MYGDEAHVKAHGGIVLTRVFLMIFKSVVAPLVICVLFIGGGRTLPPGILKGSLP